MTDHEEPSDDDARWFRTHIDPLVDQDVPDAWDHIRDRATGAGPTVVPLPAAAGRSRPGRRMIATAAALVLVAGAVGLAVLATRSGDDDRLATDASTTGFYVPGDLPEGWRVTSVYVHEARSDDVDRLAADCPCKFAAVTRDDGHRYLAMTSSGGPDALGAIDADRQPLAELDGWYEEDGPIRAVIWRTPTGSRSIASGTIERGGLEALATGWTDDLPSGDGVHAWSIDHEIEVVRSIAWTISNTDTGQSAHVSLEPKVVGYSVFAFEEVELSGNHHTAGVLDGIGQASLVADWGDAQIMASVLRTAAGDEAQAPPADQATVQAILGSFHPADAEGWAAHLAAIGEDSGVTLRGDLDSLMTDRLGDWLVLSGPSKPTDREVEISDGDPADPASAITVTIDVEELIVAPGESFAVEVTMTNETGATLELSGCPFGGAEWSAIGTDGTEFFGGSRAVDCSGEPYPWADGEVRTETFEFVGRGSEPLSEGPFTAQIKFFNPDVTIAVPGTVKG